MNEEEKRSHEKRRRATDGSVFGNSGSGARAEGLILMAEWEMGERREQKETERGREGGWCSPCTLEIKIVLLEGA